MSTDIYFEKISFTPKGNKKRFYFDLYFIPSMEVKKMIDKSQNEIKEMYLKYVQVMMLEEMGNNSSFKKKFKTHKNAIGERMSKGYLFVIHQDED